ncbi:MAG: hypothetical protein PHY12_05375, partial [Eubacteriales bacterium]|nr:hypothetical protein [Eubacteriales bacterium]
MNLKKRILSFVLCAALLLSLAPAALAQSAEPVNALLFPRTDDANRNLNTSAVAGGTLYLSLSDYNVADGEERDAFYAWKPGDAEPVKLELAGVSSDVYDASGAAEQIAAGMLLINKLFADGDTLYGLCASTGDLWKLVDASGVLAKPEAMPKLDWSNMMTGNDEYAYAKDLSQLTVVDGKLYAIVSDWEKQTAAERKSVCSWDLSTGAAGAPITGQLILSLAPYKDGKLLCKVQDEDNSWDAQKQQSIPPDISVFDPATGKAEKLMTAPDSSIVCLRYNAENGMAYYVSTTEITRLNLETGETAVSAYLPEQVWDDGSMFLWGGMAAVVSYSSAYVRALDLPSVAAGALTIYGEYGSSAHMAFVASHPDVAVNSSDMYYSTLDGFTNAMVSGDGTLDVARLNSNYSPLSRLIDKGYAMDLSAYSDLVDYVNTMDSRFTDFCKRDGKLYAVPVEMSGTLMGYNADVWKDLGLTEDDLPTSLMGLLDFVENWAYDYGEDHPEYKLFDDTNSKTQLLNWIMNTYVTYCQKMGESSSFDTELFRKLLAKLEQIDFTE